MNKKWLMLGSAIGISGVVMVTTGVAAMAGASGYDTYKTAVKTTGALNSATVAASLSVQDNGQTLIDANGTVKADRKDRTASGTGTLSSGGTDLTGSFYKTATQTVLKTSMSDTYYVKQDPARKGRAKSREDKNPQMAQQVETVIDALVGNLKDQVSLDPKADGTKEVSLQLSDAQVPALLNALAPIGIKQALSGHEHAWKSGNKGKTDDGSNQPLPFDPQQLVKLPQLTQDIKIDNIAVTADINAQNEITHQAADVSISGKDASGVAHVLTLQLTADLSNENATTPDTIDLTGKTVQQLKGEAFGRHPGWHDQK